ncbi:hypothetical protein SAMN02745218_01373 [Desulfofundulus australicus DSM 11792]|uniref:DUF2062 domain-containing protein n=1 Tax=Desulfofundulus australicus DSM 11792 TaxID=1121425 RepID=A0A1M4YLG9_9FIRM|nr:DUF2062 domain-containing protein [Desulfofundulus australicus]SHF06601.1 hypothetical protein SAMN02745218_01373 [Desulfofundulus australicus DSM 11792]
MRIKEKILCWKNKIVVEYYHKIMVLPGAPHKIAHGVALGTALDFFPIPFISIPVAYLLARCLKVNGVAAALAAAFFKWAVPFFYILNYLVGNAVTGCSVAVETGTGGSLPTLKQLSYPFFVGAAINAAAAWLLIYFPVRRILEMRRTTKHP